MWITRLMLAYLVTPQGSTTLITLEQGEGLGASMARALGATQQTELERIWAAPSRAGTVARRTTQAWSAWVWREGEGKNPVADRILHTLRFRVPVKGPLLLLDGHQRGLNDRQMGRLKPLLAAARSSERVAPPTSIPRVRFEM